MLNHAAAVEAKNSERKAKAKVAAQKKRDEEDPVLPDIGKRMSEIEKDPAMFEQYMDSLGG